MKQVNAKKKIEQLEIEFEEMELVKKDPSQPIFKKTSSEINNPLINYDRSVQDSLDH
jgi:hypothetical protein